MPGGELPFVSFCVKSYNQRELALAALEGAFRQLEIVIYDDASGDGSAWAIREAIERARAAGEKRKIVFQAGQTNLGNAGSWQKVCALASGDLLIKADGDDISLPSRTAKVVAAWVSSGKKHDIVSCGYWKTDPSGNVIGSCCKGAAYGAASAYARRLYTSFGDVSFPRGGDDSIYAFRAELLKAAGRGGGVLDIPDRLVIYRYGTGFSTAGADYAAWLARSVRLEAVNARQALADLDSMAGSLPAAFVEEKRLALGCLIERADSLARLVESRSFVERWKAYKKVPSSGERLFARLLYLALVLPPRLRNPLFNLAARLRSCCLRFKYRRIDPLRDDMV